MAAAKATDEPTVEDLAAKVADLEAQNEALRAAAEKPSGETKLAWVVIYPRISVQPKGDDGEPKGEPVVLEKGSVLPDDCMWQAEFLKSIGHVTALTVRA